MSALDDLFRKHFGVAPATVTPVQDGLGGSGRRILRMGAGTATAVGIEYRVRQENAAFIGFSEHFRALGLPVPAIYGHNLDSGCYIMEDLGGTTLYQLLQSTRDGDQVGEAAMGAYKKAIAWLPRFQVDGACGLDWGLCCPRDAFDRQSIEWDLNYFKYYFLRLSGLAFDEQALQDDFNTLADFLLQAPQDYFLYRDFQSRNIMVRDGEPWFLDYQGGRRGALQYDIASLLFDAKADLPHAVRHALLDLYLEELQERISISRDDFLRHYFGFVYIRIFQALGAYGYRGYFERKPLFLASVPYALRNIAWLLQNVALPVEMPELMRVCRAMVASEKLQSLAPLQASGPQRTLHVHVGSFSFHRGLPQDDSGHGGGFIFDARSLPNPGRLAEYRDLTGKDAAVAEYLAKQPAADEFYQHALAMVEASVRSYQARGFEHLTVYFGCTGGQHRSVYMAEKLARQLGATPGAAVTLEHRELTRMGL